MEVVRPIVTSQLGVIGNTDEIAIGLIDKLRSFGSIDPDQHRRAVGQSTEAALAFAHIRLGAFALGDIHVDAENAPELAVRIVPALTPRGNPTNLSGAVHDAIFDVEDLLFTQRIGALGLDAREVFNVNELAPFVITLDRLAYAVKIQHLGRPREAVAPGLPIPNSDVGGRLCQAATALRCATGFLQRRFAR